MSTVQVFERNGFKVEWEKPALTVNGIYWLIGEVAGFPYRKAYGGGSDAMAKAVAACKRKGGPDKTPRFTEKFGSYVCPNDFIRVEIDGLRIDATLEFDQDSSVDDAECYLPIKIKQWRNDEWFFVGVVLSVTHIATGIELSDHAASLWGTEANFNKRANRYLTQVANELLPEALQVARDALAKLKAA